MQRVSDIIGEITAAATEQSQGIGEVNTSVSQLDQMTQQNAALVEQSAAAAESLKEQAARLSDVVATFRLDRAAPTQPRPQTLATKAVPPLTRKVSPTPAVLTRGVVKQVAAKVPAALTAAPAGGDWETF